MRSVRMNPARLTATLWALLLAALALALPAPAQAEPADIEAAARGVVRVVIAARDGDAIYPVSHGTGFVVSDERIVTNAHVVAEAVNNPGLAIGLVPPEGGDAIYARLVAVSPRNDLALLATTTAMNLPVLTISGNPDARSGSVSAIGFPRTVDQAQGLSASDIFRAMPPVISTGFLSGSRPSREFDTLLHTAPIARGNSGGPLVDDCGRVLGVNSFGAEGDAAEAEFFFAVSTRELLPFLREHGVQPQLNALPCRSLAELEEAESDRADSERAAAATLAQQRDRGAEQLRRELGYEISDARLHLTALAVLLAGIGLAAAAGAVRAHRGGNLPQRKLAGGLALAALALAVVMLAFRPSWSQIDHRMDDALAAAAARRDAGASPTPQSLPAAEGSTAPMAAENGQALACALDQDRSRVTGAPQQDIALQWSAAGCVNARTQYGLDSGEWTRAFVPADEPAVSVNRFDPATGEYVVERYLLDRPAMLAARAAREGYDAPACGGGETAARELGSAQAALLASLPSRPNERLVYSCRTLAGGQ